MKTKLLFVVVLLLLTSNFGLAQTKYKEINWEEVGLKFKVPSFIKVNSKEDEGLELESEDFLVYVDLVDEFDSLDELIEYFEVKKVINRDENINEKTFKGSAAAGFSELTSEGDDIDMYNVFGNLESKFNQKEKIAFDISIYEFNDKIEDQLNTIMGSIEFYQKGSGNSKGKGKMFASKNLPEDDISDYSNVSNQEIAVEPVKKKKKSFLSSMLDFASPIISNVVPFGGVATDILKGLVD